MKYQGPIERTNVEINLGLANSEITTSERIGLILSALYYCETNVAADLLIKQIKEAPASDKPVVANLLTTLYGMHHTIYRIDESIELLLDLKSKYPHLALEVLEDIDELNEYKSMRQ